jgi:hypothetical protein
MQKLRKDSTYIVSCKEVYFAYLKIMRHVRLSYVPAHFYLVIQHLPTFHLLYENQKNQH